MTITARFAGRCARCRQPIAPGAVIDWDKTTRATTHAEPCAPVPEQMDIVLDGAPIAAFLGRAKARGLKFPKARFLAPDGQSELRLSVAGDRSRVPGAINVVVGTEWRGRVRPDGTLDGALALDATLVATLRRIALEPAQCAKEYGALMGRCSFCNLTLTDEGSVGVGYGSRCAEKYGLPHRHRGTPGLRPVGGNDDRGNANAPTTPDAGARLAHC